MDLYNIFNDYVPKRPTIRSTKGAVSTGHYLATQAGSRILNQGGNAIDAGVAAGLCLNVVHNDMCSLSGVAPIILYNSSKRKVFSLAGVGVYGEHTNVDVLIEKYKSKKISWPDNTIVPAALDSWITALRDHGTKSFSEVVQPALEYCEDGYPVGKFQNLTISTFIDTYRLWKVNKSIFLVNNKAPEVGERIIQKQLSNTIKKLINIEKNNSLHGRESALTSIRDYFYKEKLSSKLVDFGKNIGSVLNKKDYSNFKIKYEIPHMVKFHDMEIYTCGPWSQGPVLIQSLKFLDSYKNDYLKKGNLNVYHQIVESLKLAFNDRNQFYGDPDFVKVPMKRLLSKEYAKQKIYKNITDFKNDYNKKNNKDDIKIDQKNDMVGTSYVAVMDCSGNIFSATPSDGYSQGGICPELGLHISERGSQGSLAKNNPNFIMPMKRPRITPNPSIILKNGSPYMALGSPGNDRQPQAMLQVLLNMEIFGFEPQKAIELPRLASFSFPSATHPNKSYPNLLMIEEDFPDQIAILLKEYGHNVKKWPRMFWQAGGVCLVRYNHCNNTFESGADPRRDSYAQGI